MMSYVALEEREELELEALEDELEPVVRPQRSGKGESRRKSEVDRRCGLERRRTSASEAGYTGAEHRSGNDRRGTGLERRRGPGRRLSDDRRNAEEGEMSDAQFEFIRAIDTYKKVNKRMYPTWTEVLEVFRQLGYRKVKPREVDLSGVPEAAMEKE
jgi:hypothetical protein